jgi:hypothetical protein
VPRAGCVVVLGSRSRWCHRRRGAAPLQALARLQLSPASRSPPRRQPRPARPP